ncbi:hypothetical protein FIBSPDRAFT_1001766 [Athelia psychrophila]|uniref:Uncharacterized protein n=1 Tax=Athelia psychrophila TaxID=1759441 RepID=A0A166QIP3_9AGAM|nr:hypothetical protein FIBSPDRAFT_1001766 [Fibularhizoctonia sp. CBS 109695]
MKGSPRRRIELLDLPHHRRQRQAGLPHQAGCPPPYRVKLCCDGHSCYRTRRTDDRKRKYVRGCIANTVISIFNQGVADVPGLTDNIIPKRLGPKPATKIPAASIWARRVM